MKNRVATRRLPGVRNHDPLTLLWPKMVSKRCLFENPENRKGHLKPTFYKSLALGPSKNSPRQRFWKKKNRKWIRKWKGFYSLVKLKSIEKQTLSWFLVIHKNDDKTTPKGTVQILFWGSKMATRASQVRLIFWFWTFWCDAKKPCFFIGPITTNNNWKSTKKPKRAARVVPRFHQRAEPGVWRGGTAGIILYCTKLNYIN